jgi:hypothetical protein
MIKLYKNELLSGIDSKNLLHVSIYIKVIPFVILIFAFLAVLPTYSSLYFLDSEIASLDFKIKEKERLKPVYQMMINNLNIGNVGMLPFPARSKLSKDKIFDLFRNFTQIAEENGMKGVSIQIKMNTLDGESKYLVTMMEFKGEFKSLRNVLIKFFEVPYLERIENIEIVQPMDEKLKTFRVVCWIATT